MKIFQPLLLFFLCSYFAQAQKPGDNIFNQTILHEVRLVFNQADYWSTLTSNYENTPVGGSIPYVLAKVTIDGTLIDSIGVRFKGFTSYTDQDKKPIKLDFNEFVSGQKYDGLRKLNLNNGTADPSMQRDVICYQLLRNSGVKAPRTAYSKVYINDEYWGLYQNIEQIDKTFLKNNFSHSSGHLFKNLGWNHLEWLGNDPDAYHPPFALKTNIDNANWGGFVNFMDVLNNSTNAEFPTAIKEVFNVNLFLKTLAVDVATNNWDSYLEHGRNWYMYEDTVTGLFNWIPWDYNLALGGSLAGGDGYTCHVYPLIYGHTTANTTVRFLNLGFISDTPTYLWDFGDGATSTEKEPIHEYATQGEYVVCLTLTLNENCMKQTCQTINTTVDKTCPVITNQTAPHEENAAFFTVVQFVSECCSNWTQSCEDFYVNLSGGSSSFDYAIDQTNNSGVLIKRLLSVPEYNTQYHNYFCDLMKNQMTKEKLFATVDQNKLLISDAIQADGNYLFNYNAFLTDIGATSDTTGIKAILAKRIDSLNLELINTYTCPDIQPIPFQAVAINELVASNDSTSNISDSDGEFEDWIELHNNTNSDLDLSVCYLSDDFTKPKKWAFPAETIIPANGYLIVWADKDANQMGLHADFKLKKSGDEIFLSNADGSAIDSISFSEQSTNVAYARNPDGVGNFVFQDATFNANNETVSNQNIKNTLVLSITPTLAKDLIKIQISEPLEAQINIFSSTGQKVFSGTISSSLQVPLENLSNGFYLVQIRNQKGAFGVGRFVIQR